MCKYLMGILLGIGICFPAYADYSCATAFMNDSTELAKLNNEIGAKSSALQKNWMINVCLNIGNEAPNIQNCLRQLKIKKVSIKNLANLKDKR